MKLLRFDLVTAAVVAFLFLTCAVIVLAIMPTGWSLALNTRFGGSANILLFGSTVFAALALVVAGLAYRAATKQPNLTLAIRRDSVADDAPLVLHVNPRTNRVVSSQVAVGQQWRLWLTNTGSASARYPVVEVDFGGITFDPAVFKGWTATEVVGGRARTFRWTAPSDMVMHPNFPMEMDPLRLNGVAVHRSEGPSMANVVVTIAADGFFLKGPPLAIQLDFSAVNRPMEDWLVSRFKVQLTPDGVDRVAVQMNPNGGGSTVAVDWLANQLGDRVPPTYEELRALPLSAQEHWRAVWDRWKAEGIVR